MRDNVHHVRIILRAKKGKKTMEYTRIFDSYRIVAKIAKNIIRDEEKRVFNRIRSEFLVS